MTNMKIIVLVQARLSSSRLPGKVLQPLGSRVVVGQVFHQLSFLRNSSQIVLVTSVENSDSPLVDWAIEQNVPYYRGSLHDVLDRYYQAALYYKADAIVRITADCPLIDPQVVDVVIHRFMESGVDYCSNVLPPTFPDGLDTEVIKFSALQTAWREATLPSEREHVTPYIRNHPEQFTKTTVVHTPSLEQYRWTLDTAEDYDFLQRVVKEVEQPGKPIFYRQVLELLQQKPELMELNNHLKRNEGYSVSLQQGTK